MEIIDTTQHISNQENDYIDKVLLHASQKGLSNEEFNKMLTNAIQEFHTLQVKSKIKGTATQEEERQLHRYDEINKFIGILQDFDEDEYYDAFLSEDEEKMLQFIMDKGMDQLDKDMTIYMNMGKVLDEMEKSDAELDDEMKDKLIQSFSQRFEATRINEAIKDQKFEYIDEDTMSTIAYLILKKKQFVKENDLSVFDEWINIDDKILEAFVIKYLERHPIQIGNEKEEQSMKENNLNVNNTDSIQMQIAKTAAKNWGQEEPTTLEESLKITWDSEVSAVQGIVKTLNLDESVIEQLIGKREENGSLSRDGEIYTGNTISEEIASKIRDGIQGEDKNKNILRILSTIHDNWVKNNSNNFLKPDRNKERQFVPLELLNWEEVESDLLFLKPILEASGIEIYEKELKNQHAVQQTEYLIDNEIFSHDNLVHHLSRGENFYPALNGLETKNGGNISELLNNNEIAENMARQIEGKVKIQSRDDLATSIIRADNSAMDEVLWAETVDDTLGNLEKCPTLNKPISQREILLSKIIGRPYPTYFLESVRNHMGDSYRNIVRKPKESELEEVQAYKDTISSRKKESEEITDESFDKKGNVRFGYDETAQLISGQIEVSRRDLLKAGIDPESMEFKDKSMLSSRDIAKADKEQALTTTEVGGIKGIINKIKEFFRGKGEK